MLRLLYLNLAGYVGLKVGVSNIYICFKVSLLSQSAVRLRRESLIHAVAELVHPALKYLEHMTAVKALITKKLLDYIKTI